MKSWRVILGLLLAGLFMLDSGPVQARVPTQRTNGFKSTGARQDITVPYLTTGRSAFMPGAVSPRIYSSPVVNDPANPGSRPVFNLIFYGSTQSFGGGSNGAIPKR